MKKHLKWAFLTWTFVWGVAQVQAHTTMRGGQGAPARFQLVSQTQRPATSSELKVFKQLYARHDDAVRQRNVGALARLLASNFVIISRSGNRLNRAQFVQINETAMRRVVKVHSAHTKIESITMGKNEAILITSNFTDYLYRNPDGKNSRIVETGRTQSTWIQTPQGWKCRLARELSYRQTVDGRVAS